MSEVRIALPQIATAGYDQAANLETGLAAYRRPGCYGRLTDEGPAAQKSMLEK